MIQKSDQNGSKNICYKINMWKTGILSVQNYDPRLRFKSINMMLTLLLPPHISTKSAHKFYSFLEDELNELYEIGVDNGKLKGIDLYVVNHYR